MVLKNILITLLFLFSSAALSNVKLLKTRKKIARSLKKSSFYKPQMGHLAYKQYLKKLAKRKKPTRTEAKRIAFISKIEANLVIKYKKKMYRNSALNNLYFSSKYKINPEASSALYKKLSKKKKKKVEENDEGQVTEDETSSDSSAVSSPQRKKFSIGLSYMSWQEDRKLIENGTDKEIFNSVVAGPALRLEYTLMESAKTQLNLEASYQMGKLSAKGDTYSAEGLKTSTITAGSSFLFKVNESFYLGPSAKFLIRSTDYPLGSGQLIEQPNIKTALVALNFKMEQDKFSVYSEVGHGMAFSSFYFGFGFSYLVF